MSGPADHENIPEKIPPLPLPEFDYEDLDKEERIGTGGDADVYKATVEHKGYTYSVAVKEPRFEGTIQKRVVERFADEAETWGSLDDHENIVSVYSWGSEPLPWLGLEYMDGGTLKDKIGSIDVAQALWLSGRIAEGIRYGHRHGVAHLDIKPTNVLLRETGSGTWDYPKVSDWGLAKMLLEHSNSVEGISPTYAAPEQFDSEEYGSTDDITDIYQLGVLVYALVAGEPPFTGSSTSVMQGVLQKQPEPPSAVNSAVPSAVDDVVLKALAKQKGNRYEGILTFRQELDRLFEEFTTGENRHSGQAVAGATGVQTTSEDTSAGEDTNTSGQTENTQSHGQTVTDRSERSSPKSSTPTDSGDGSGPVSRRNLLGVVGAGILGAGGVAAITQMDGNNNGQTASGGGGGPSDDSGSGRGENVPEEVHTYLTDNSANLYEGKASDRTGNSEVTVQVGADDGFAFDHPAILVDAGTWVVWEWTGQGGNHHVESAESSATEFRSGDPQSGSDLTYSMRFDESGNQLYYCFPHRAAGMHGAVIVV